MTLSRRDFIHVAATMGAALAWGGTACKSRTNWRERRDLYPEGVASGDPDPHSVILWTRRPFDKGDRHALTVEVAEDEAFRRVIAHAPAAVSAASDWTTRVLVAGLMPAQVYWYRFTDADGNGSRVGRTMTAPTVDDPRPVNFAFVSCQTINEGKLNAYRRMIFEDERAAQNDQLAFVLHLGDFIYEVVQYPEEAKTRYDRTIYEVARLPDGHKVGNFHIPLTLDGYRAIYKGYLHNPDLQDARALAVRRHVGQSRVFMGGPAEHRKGGFVRAAGPDHQDRRQSGVVRISPRARRSTERIARAVRTTCRQERPDREVR